jgi:CheY-like chemotaxis protein
MSPQPPCIVVVVEDEPVTRVVAAFALEDAGLQVIEAASADEAVAILERDAASVHAVFTDIQTPGLIDGMGLARHIDSKWPHIGVVVTSGRLRPRADQLPNRCRFFRKPYNMDNIVRHIRKIVPPECG